MTSITGNNGERACGIIVVTTLSTAATPIAMTAGIVSQPFLGINAIFKAISREYHEYRAKTTREELFSRMSHLPIPFKFDFLEFGREHDRLLEGDFKYIKDQCYEHPEIIDPLIRIFELYKDYHRFFKNHIKAKVNLKETGLYAKTLALCIVPLAGTYISAMSYDPNSYAEKRLELQAIADSPDRIRQADALIAYAKEIKASDAYKKHALTSGIHSTLDKFGLPKSLLNMIVAYT